MFFMSIPAIVVFGMALPWPWEWYEAISIGIVSGMFAGVWFGIFGAAKGLTK